MVIRCKSVSTAAKFCDWISNCCFSDVSSDIGVCAKLYETGNPIWGSMAATLLVGQVSDDASRLCHRALFSYVP